VRLMLRRFVSRSAPRSGNVTLSSSLRQFSTLPRIPIASADDNESTLDLTRSKTEEVLAMNEKVTQILQEHASTTDNSTLGDIGNTTIDIVAKSPENVMDVINMNVARYNATYEAAVAAGDSGHWINVQMAQDMFLALQPMMDSWMGSVVVGTIALRMLIFPCFVEQQKFIVRQKQYMPGLLEIQQRFKAAVENREQDKMMETRLEIRDYAKMHRLGLSNMFLPAFASAPVFASVFFALKSEILFKAFPELTTAGALTFVNLTVPDPNFLLPWVCGMLNYIQLSLTPLAKESNEMMVNIFKVAKYGFPVLIVMTGLFQPAVSIELFEAFIDA
jgi:membrane protein insertase Oxa1/YidC/SpoIIIJ